MKIQQYTGGSLQTNAFLIRGRTGNVLFDAPEGTARWLREEGVDSLDWLLLTHGHFDHMDGAREVIAACRPRVAYHRDGESMITEPGHFLRMGFPLEVETIEKGELIDECPSAEFGGEEFQIFLVPGHCPGSLCFYHAASGNLIGGDVLFAGGIGRWDLPCGNLELLLAGIYGKLLPLPDDTVVHPGHGPSTTIGTERISNPFLR